MVRQGRRESTLAGVDELQEKRHAMDRGNVVAEIALWKKAMRWRRLAEKELAPLKLTLIQWLVLDATSALIFETKDAVSQKDVSARLELDKMTVSHIMKALADLQLVDREPDMFCRGWRIWVTKKGMAVLEEGRNRVAGVST